MSQTNAVPKGTVNVQTFLNENPFSRFQWLIFAVCFFIVLLDGFDTSAIGFIAPSLLKEWGLQRPDLAPVLSAALFGLAFGAISSGPLADKFGRRLVLFAAVLLFGLASLASAFAGSLDMLVALRFVTGLGLGAAMPNAVTMMSEYCPDNRRSMLTNAMFSGFPLGAALGGFLAKWLIPNFGWRSVLVFGGTVPLLLLVVMVFILPESLRYMVAKLQPVEKIRAALARISSNAAEGSAFTMSESLPSKAGQSAIGIVLSPRYAIGSIMMWVAYFSGLIIFYALINWLPLLLKDAGFNPEQSSLIAALFPLGGVGAILSGWLMDRYNGNWVIGLCYFLTAAALYAVGMSVGNGLALTLLIFLAGALFNTAQSSLPALAAAFYPTAGRATGVSWMMGFGRFGAIVGTFLVAELTRRNYNFAEIFTVVAIPGLISGGVLLIKQLFHPQPKIG